MRKSILISSFATGQPRLKVVLGNLHLQRSKIFQKICKLPKPLQTLGLLKSHIILAPRVTLGCRNRSSNLFSCLIGVAPTSGRCLGTSTHSPRPSSTSSSFPSAESNYLSHPTGRPLSSTSKPWFQNAV